MVGIVAAVVAVSSYAQYDQRKVEAGRQRRYQEEQARIAQQRADVENVRATRNQLRQQRQAQGQISNAAGLSGTQGSSGALGSFGAAATRTAGELNYIDVTAGLSSEYNKVSLQAAQSAADSAVRVAGWGALGSIAGAMGGALNRPENSTGGKTD